MIIGKVREYPQQTTAWGDFWLAAKRLVGIASRPKIHAISSPFATRGYQGAANTTQNRDWLTQHYSGDAAIGAAWDNVTQRARDLVRNEPWAAQAIQRITQNVVGHEGILAQSEIEDDDGTLDEDTGAEIDAWFERWCEECDAEGEMDFAELQAVAMGEAPEVGECFFVEVADPDPVRTIPLCYQLFEPEQINETLDGVQAGANVIKRGIEFNRMGQRVAYHFYADHPYDLVISSLDTVRVPASRVIHYYEKRRPSQTRGITWFAPILQTLRDMSKYIGTEMSSAETAARFAVAIKRAAGAGTGLGFAEDGADATDANSNALEYLGFPIIGDIGAQDSIETVQASGRPNSQAEPWIKLILHSMANGIGLTYLGLTGDTREASFSSSRFAHNKDKIFYRTLQGRFGRKVVKFIRQRAVSQLVAMRRISSITPAQLRANSYRLLATHLLPPGWEEIQSGEEVAAAIERIQAGLSTLQDECAGRGKNWRRILRQRYRELAEIKDYELDLTTNYPGRVAVSNRLQGGKEAMEAATDANEQPQQ